MATERRSKQAFKRHISEREVYYPSFQQEFGHIEGDTILGARHQSEVITLVERLMKVIITLKPAECKACHIETALNQRSQELCSNPSRLTMGRNSPVGNRCAACTTSRLILQIPARLPSAP